MNEKKKVAIVMGSKSDVPVMEKTAEILTQFGIEFEIIIASAHLTPHLVHQYAAQAAQRGIAIIIAGAGSAAHLAGALASETNLPVIGVPLPSSPFNGLDSLLSTIQMPAGIPVATMAVGQAGATNAGILAAQILALSDPDLARALQQYRQRLAEEVQNQSYQYSQSLNRP